MIRGCVPKKLMVYASHFRRELDHASGFGWTVPSATFDWSTLIANKDEEIARLERVYTANLEKAGVRIAKTRTVLEHGNRVRLATGETVRAGHTLLATGSTPNLGRNIPGLKHVISSNELFYLSKQPKRILIQSGGYIALEFACIFAGLGFEVTVVYRGKDVLRGFDQDVRAHVRREMERAGIRILTECVVKRVEKLGDEHNSYLSDGSIIASRSSLLRHWP